MKRTFLFALLLCAACGVGFAPQANAAPALKTFTITSGPLGGDFYALGGVIGEAAKAVLPGVTVTVNTGGSVENILKIDSGKAELGTSMAKLYMESLKGVEAFKGRKPVKNVSVMMYVAPMPMAFFMVKEGSPFKSIQEIADKKPKLRLLTSMKGSSPAAASENMLKKYGISFETIREWGGTVSFVSYAEASSLMQDGHADAYVGPMVSAINEMVTTVKMRQLPIDPAKLKELEADGYMVYTLKKGAYYFVPEDTPHMAEVVILPISRKLPEDAVYNLTKALCEKPAMIRGVHATYSVFEPSRCPDYIARQYIHPGALRYYKEQGWVK
jgi:TRAP transporter solute receptor, TAXI family